MLHDPCWLMQVWTVDGQGKVLDRLPVGLPEAAGQLQYPGHDYIIQVTSSWCKGTLIQEWVPDISCRACRGTARLKS